MTSTITLQLDVLILDADIQPRETMSNTLIREYAALYRDGFPLPPITVFHDGADYWVADGFHRRTAALEAGLSEIPVDIEVGTKREAMLYSCGANKHGKARTPEDKRRAIRRLLADPEWQGWSNVEIARHCGVAQSLVAKVRQSLFSEQSDAHQRTYRTKHGTIATMDTSRIGRIGGTSTTEEPRLSTTPSPLADQVVSPDVPTISAPVSGRLAIGGDSEREHGPEVLDTEEIPRTSIEAAFPAMVDPAEEVVGSLARLKTATLQYEPSDVLRLMDELRTALRQRDTEVLATACEEWSLHLIQQCFQTCSELIELLQALGGALERHHLTTERVLLEPAVGSPPDGQERAGQHAVWERVTALEIEGLDDAQIAARLNAEEGRRRWNRGAIRALRRAHTPEDRHFLLNDGAPMRA
jgi:hypothetical protein